MFNKLYNKTIKLAGNKNSKFFLGTISFVESFIFPIPPDVIIVPMTIAKPKKWFKIALIATSGSVLGAILGYFIGYVFFNEIGIRIFELYGVDNTSFLKDKVSSDGGAVAWMTLLAIAGFSSLLSSSCLLANGRSPFLTPLVILLRIRLRAALRALLVSVAKLATLRRARA